MFFSTTLLWKMRGTIWSLGVSSKSLEEAAVGFLAGAGVDVNIVDGVSIVDGVDTWLRASPDTEQSKLALLYVEEHGFHYWISDGWGSNFEKSKHFCTQHFGSKSEFLTQNHSFGPKSQKITRRHVFRWGDKAKNIEMGGGSQFKPFSVCFPLCVVACE